MIDLTRTRAGFLAEIEAPAITSVPSSDITELRSTAPAGHVCITDQSHGDLFPLLKLALLEWFASVTREQLMRDLLLPLKCALGNARKHGNGNDPAKAVCVELVLTRRGALVAVTDEGAGFDAEQTLRRFQGREGYYVNQGAGFRILHHAVSVVSYENGGRTMLLCFRPVAGEPSAASSNAARADRGFLADVEDDSRDRQQFSGKEYAFAKILDADWVQTCLATVVPEFADASTRLESCRVYAARGRASDRCGHRYLLRVSSRDGGRVRTRTLTGRLHATQAEAAADFEAATCLLDAGISKSVLIPRPIARPAAEPRLVLYEFDPWTTLWEYMDMYRSRRALRHCTESVARALARLHGSQLRFRGAAPDPAMDSLPALVARTETIFQGRTTGSEEIAPLLRCLVAWIQQQAANMCPPVPAPILGARDWSWIYYGVDSRFYLHHFEACRHADPGLDLGGFAADLLCFTVAKHDDELWRICAEALLRNYNEQAAHPIEETTLRFYTALALVDRFRRARPDWRALRGAVSALLRSLGPLAATQRTVIGQTGLLASRAAR